MLFGILILGIIIVALLIQRIFKIPTPITILFSTMILKYFNINYVFTNESFDSLVILTIPLLITSDAIRLSFHELKTHWVSLFSVAVLAVIISVGLGVLVDNLILPEYKIGVAGVIMLMCMLTATDPVTVSSIFSNVEVPHKLKLFTEGESLFNDATALILFSMALTMLADDNVQISTIAIQSGRILAFALIIGLIIGGLSCLLLKLTDDVMVETTIILLAAYSSFELGEHFKVSSILAVIVSILLISRQIDVANKLSMTIQFMNKKITSLHNQQQMNHIFEYFSIIFSSLLFIAIASVTDLHSLLNYWKEILLMFVISTIIRAITMAKFAVVSNKIAKMHNISKHWWAVLTMAGSKGALSLLMVHMIPNSFVHKALFENIIIGNIILSTVIYTIGLYLVIFIFKDQFKKEVMMESM